MTIRSTVLLLACIALLTGCDVESNFVLQPVALPAGLQNDQRLTGVNVSRVEVFFYTNDPVTIYVFDNTGKRILSVEGTWSSATDDKNKFYITVNGVERGYLQIAPGKLKLLPDDT